MCDCRLSVLVVVAIAIGCGGPRDARPRDASVAARPAEVQGGPALVNADRELVQSIEPFVDRLAEADQFSGVVLVWRHGQPLLERAVGRADRERRRANTVDTPFALASVSKMFTAVVIAQLVDQELVSLDAPIGALLPAYPRGEARRKVTVHHLLTMSSGIPRSVPLATLLGRCGHHPSLP